MDKPKLSGIFKVIFINLINYTYKQDESRSSKMFLDRNLVNFKLNITSLNHLN